VTLAECDRMVDAARRAGVALLVGHSHSFDSPYLRTAELIAGGAYGAARMITAVNFTDFLYRPRRAEELVTAQGGGVVFSQAAHQVDIARLLGGGRVRSVRAATGAWDAARATEGAYQAFLSFESGAVANLVYNGYGRFDTDELMGWIGETGQERDPARYGAARSALRRAVTPAAETALKMARTYGAAAPAPAAAHHNHFGLVIVSCEGADLRPVAEGVWIYDDQRRWLEPLPPPALPRFEVVEELVGVLRHGRKPLHSGEWGRATLEVCLGILGSARSGAEIMMTCQIGVGDHTAIGTK
jgi:phthalate 4,5-cis-dihydrodiol dehydrogenase